jgi:hypothetical protein
MYYLFDKKYSLDIKKYYNAIIVKMVMKTTIFRHFDLATELRVRRYVMVESTNLPLRDSI